MEESRTGEENGSCYGLGNYINRTSRLKTEKEFKQRVMAYCSQPGWSYWLNENRWQDEYDNPKEEWIQEWKQLSPNTEPFVVTLTASDAINIIPSVVQVIRKDNKNTRLLFLEGSYGSARGLLTTFTGIPTSAEYAYHMCQTMSNI